MAWFGYLWGVCRPSGRGQLKFDGTRADFVFRRNGRVHLNRRGTLVQSTTGSRGVRISGSNAGYTMFRGSEKGTGYPLHSLPFTSSPVRYRVPSHFSWSLLPVYCIKIANCAICHVHLDWTYKQISYLHLVMIMNLVLWFFAPCIVI